ALVCLEAIYRFSERWQYERRPRPNALMRCAAISIPLIAYGWITAHIGRVSTFWHRFGFAYFVTDEGSSKLYWWVPGTDILIGVLLVILLLVITTRRRATIILFITGYVWANLARWPRWYEWLGLRTDFQSGFPFPFY